ncbi:hypothetical protein AOCH_005111 [Aspergillus ochraceoroseus]|uniref:RNA interference and gene silencing protein n=1 Tax=Aspergillus ochraceoroseus TaxID=138278 RepID=A0A0F8U1Q1_9EURO|nr:hypothetical protein AOCH_005111 [Aspergillus ochraceoroseus]
MSTRRGQGRGGARGRGYGRGRGAPIAVQVYSPPEGVHVPDQRVTKAEDTFSESAKGPLGLGGLQLDQEFPNRPGYGTRGINVTLWANYVELVPPLDLTLHRYDIAVTPSATGKKLRQVIKLLLETPEMAAFKTDVITDFASTLISRRRLDTDESHLEIPYRTEGEDEPRPNATTYRVRLQHTNVLQVAHLVEYLTSTDLSSRCDDKSPLIQAFNIFLNHYSKSTKNLATTGTRKTFPLSSSSARWDLGAGLSAIRGFFSSVRTATSRILVNVNVTHGAFYDDIPLDELIIKYNKAHRNSKTSLNAFLKGLRVQTTHLREKRNKAGQIVRRIKTVTGLATKNDGHGLAHPPIVDDYGVGPKRVQFWLDSAPPDGKYISVYNFFLNTHGRSIANPDLAVVNVGTRQNPSYLPPEVCVVVPGQSSNSKLDPAQTQGMIQFAVRKPWENAASIVNEGLQVSGLSSQTNILLGRFGISVSPGLITVPGRVLHEPRVVYKQNKFAPIRFGSWNMADLKFNTAGAAIKKWSYLLLSTPGHRDAFDQESLATVMGKFHRALQYAGLSLGSPMGGRRLVLSGADDPKLDNSLKIAAASLDLLFIILPESNTVLYNQIKHSADIKYGIHTICCVGHKLAKERGQEQYFANVALKFNLKLGGINQLLDTSHLGIINEDKTMVVGIDVTHPSPGSSSRAPSVAGMVASVDRWLGQWPAVLRIQRGARQEMVTDLTGMLKSRLMLWKQRHRAFPENILVYRDGVSEGQYGKVVEEELPRLRDACKALYPAPDSKKGLPHFTIIIVGKRHHTRFYPIRESDADRSSNPKPGTVVDRGVTEARNWDFFLQPHAAIQGTARPAHYYIVLDEIFRQYYRRRPGAFQNVADMVEDLTHSMCYLYGRATKAVSLCPPAYYADLVCERARCYLSGLFEPQTPSTVPSVAGSAPGEELQAGNEDVEIHTKLKDTMFYI